MAPTLHVPRLRKVTPQLVPSLISFQETTLNQIYMSIFRVSVYACDFLVRSEMLQNICAMKID